MDEENVETKPVIAIYQRREKQIIYLSVFRVRTIRAITKPSTAKCDLNTYTLFLLAESKYPGCTRLAEIMEDLSHDSVNRFLLREQYEPKDLFDEIKLYINLVGGTLSKDVGRSVIWKVRSKELVGSKRVCQRVSALLLMV